MDYGFFKIGDSLMIDGTQYRVIDVVKNESSLKDSIVFCNEQNNPRIKTARFTLGEFEQLYDAGRITEPETPDAAYPTEAESAEDQELMNRRQQVMEEALGLIYPNYDAFEHRRGKEVIQYICDKLVISDSSARFLLNRYLKSGRNPYSMLDMRQGWNTKEKSSTVVNGRTNKDGTHSKVVLNDETLNNFEMAFRYFKENCGAGANLSDAYNYLLDVYYTDEETLERLPEDECPSYRRFRSYVEKKLKDISVRDFTRNEREKFKALSPEEQKERAIPGLTPSPDGDTSSTDGDVPPEAKTTSGDAPSNGGDVPPEATISENETNPEDAVKFNRNVVNQPTGGLTSSATTDSNVPTEEEIAAAEEAIPAAAVPEEVSEDTTQDEEPVFFASESNIESEAVTESQLKAENESDLASEFVSTPNSTEQTASKFAEETAPEASEAAETLTQETLEKDSKTPETPEETTSEPVLENKSELASESTAESTEEPAAANQIDDAAADILAAENMDLSNTLNDPTQEVSDEAELFEELNLDDELKESEKKENEEKSDAKKQTAVTEDDVDVEDLDLKKEEQEKKRERDEKKQAREEEISRNRKLLFLAAGLVAVFAFFLILLFRKPAADNKETTVIAVETSSETTAATEKESTVEIVTTLAQAETTAAKTEAATEPATTIEVTSEKETAAEITAVTETTVIETTAATTTVAETTAPETAAPATTATTAAATTVAKETKPAVQETTAAVKETKPAVQETTAAVKETQAATPAPETKPAETVQNAKAGSFYTVTGNIVNVRSALDREKILGSVTQGTLLQANGTSQGNWLGIVYGGENGVIYSNYVAPVAENTAHGQYYQLTGDHVNVRDAKDRSIIYTSLPIGQVIEETGSYDDADWIRYTWNGKDVVSSRKYLQKVDENTPLVTAGASSGNGNAASAQNASYYRITSYWLNARSAQDKEIVRAYPQGTIVQKVSESDNPSWVNVRIDGQDLVMASAYLEPVTENENGPFYKVSEGGAAYYAAPDGDGEVLGKLPSGLLIEPENPTENSIWLRFTWNGKKVVVDRRDCEEVYL